MENMEYEIKKISENKHAISEEESDVIKRAIPFYNNFLERYENMLLKGKEENDKFVKTNEIVNKNPFDVNSVKQEESKLWDLPTMEEIRTLVYSSWAKIIADVQIPLGCSGQKRKNITKNSFRQVQKGKYINKKVREIMSNAIARICRSLNIEEKDETL